MRKRGRRDVERVREKYRRLRPTMHERARRLWAAAEAQSIGWGGVSRVSEATGLSRVTIGNGRAELDAMEHAPPAEAPAQQRQRRPGGGRRRLVDKDPTLRTDLDALVDPVTRGDPESPLRWTCKSTRKLAAELTRQGHTVSPQTVAEVLREQGYSLQANRKTTEGTAHPDRNAQFLYVNARTKAFTRRGQPVISVDTKKKELVGDFKNAGREWRPAGMPAKVRMHDFPDEKLGKAIPYGVYDLNHNEGWVNVGIDHDTADFAAEAVRTWWKRMGSRRYPRATDLMITADSGGSNSARSRGWKAALQTLADETGLKIAVCHFPPGTSKWNKIEHRMFCHISQNWRGHPLLTHDVIVNLIAGTTTKTGLKIRAKLDQRSYPLGVEIRRVDFERLNLARAAFHGDWNYVIAPRAST